MRNGSAIRIMAFLRCVMQCQNGVWPMQRNEAIHLNNQNWNGIDGNLSVPATRTTRPTTTSSLCVSFNIFFCGLFFFGAARRIVFLDFVCTFSIAPIAPHSCNCFDVVVCARADLSIAP